jgi:hypothetical protein
VINRLQRGTLQIPQLVGFMLSLTLGSIILLLTLQLFVDINSLLEKETDVFAQDCVVINKNISVLRSYNKEGIYFSENEIDELEAQSFTKSVSPFKVATFEVEAQIKGASGMSMLATELFFESIPNEYLDVPLDRWVWDEQSDVIPIVIPESYINLYNFGFAESQNLPVISQKTIEQVDFDIRINGQGGRGSFRGSIVGFSNKINSILVPEEFLVWANQRYGKGPNQKANRLLVEFNDPSDEAILQFFNAQNYSINENELEASKLKFIFKTALSFSFFIALVIVILSITSVLLSFSLVIQRNVEQISTLYLLGFSLATIARYYRRVLGVSTMLALLTAYLITYFIHDLVASSLATYFAWKPEEDFLLIGAIALFGVVFVLGQWKLIRAVKRVLKA